MEKIATQTSPLIRAAELAERMAQKNIIVIDARAGADAKKRYTEAHLESAIHVDLEKDLSQLVTDASNGGRHPLPPVKEFTALLGRLGINPSSHVVVYDDKAGANAASRFWWMLRSLGHEHVQVLDGGLAAAVNEGFTNINHHPGRISSNFFNFIYIPFRNFSFSCHRLPNQNCPARYQQQCDKSNH